MLALIAGEGVLPRAVAGAQDVPPLVAAFDRFRPDGLRCDEDLLWRAETMGTLLRRLQDRGVTEVCLCGTVRRPDIDPTLIDEATRPLVPIIAQALAGQGDDALMRAVIGIFEGAGFAVRAAQDVAPALLPPAGVLTTTMPSDAARNMAALGDVESAAQASRDLGQSCVIRDGAVVAREDDRGTDAMLAELALAETAARPGGLFFKAPKPGQERRADLPVIGPETARAAGLAGLDGIVVQAGGVMVLERAQTIADCDARGLFLWVRSR